MKNMRGFSVIMIFLLVFQIAHSGLDLIAAAEKEQMTSEDSAKLLVENQSYDENTITWSIVINNEQSEMAEATTAITFDDGQTHRTITDLDEVNIEKNTQGYQLSTPAGKESHTITLTTDITNDEQTNFQLSAETISEGEVFKAEEIIEIPNKADETEQEANTEEDEKDEETGEEVTEEEESGDEANQTDQGDSEETGNGEEQTMEEEIGTKSQSVFSKTANPFAIPGVMSGDEWPEPGSLNLEKEATATDNFAEWEVELNVEGINLKTSSDIVLVFDRSNSMYGSRATKAKAAAKEFVNNLLVDEHSTVRIALVPFGSDTGTKFDPHTDFQDFSGKQTLLNAIDAIQIYSSHQSGGTNIHAGLHAADEMLDNSTADQKTIVLMSDGEPTYSLKAGSATSYSWPDNKYDFILSNFNYNNRLGNGSSYNLPSGFLGIGSHRYNVDGYRVSTNGIATISEAQNIISSGKDIYAIGLEVGNVPNAIYTLENSHNKGYYQGGEGDMSPIFEEIAASLAYAATNAEVADPLGEMFDLVKDGSYNGENFEVSHGTVNWDNATETFTWDIGSVKEGETYTLKYKVTFDCEKDPKVNTKYPTNKTTTMNYTDHNGSNASKNFPIPKVSIDAGKITKLGYRVNADGEPIDSNGNVVDTPEEAKLFYDVFHDDGLTPNETYDVPAGDTPNGYVLHSDFEDPAEVDVTNYVCNVAYFGYVHESELPAGNVIATYVDEAGDEIDDPVIHEGNIGESYTTEQKDIPGYEFKEMHEDSADASGTFTSEAQTVIYVYEQLKGTIKLIKVDADNADERLAGAKFEIRDSDDEFVGELVTDDNGEVISDPLPIGDYTLVETKAPYGYELSEDQDLTVTVEADAEVPITVTNKQLKGSVKIIKVDADEEGELLEGAEFELVDENNNTLTGTTDDQGELKFDDLTIGTYTLTETKAPEGYRLFQQPIEIEITPEHLNKEKTIENTQQGWELPKTGGIGAIGFYGIGLILMGTALWFVIRRKYI